MPTNTYSDRVNILKYIKLDEGWRFAPLARKPNGNIRWDTVLIEGVELRHPEGRYFIEWRHEGRRRRKSVGTIPSEILAAAQRQLYKLAAANRIPSFKIGASVRLDPASVATWLSQRMSPLPLHQSLAEHRFPTRVPPNGSSLGESRMTGNRGH